MSSKIITKTFIITVKTTEKKHEMAQKFMDGLIGMIAFILEAEVKAKQFDL